MLKYKNNIKINKKDLKLLATSIKIKRTDKGYNKNKINTNEIQSRNFLIAFIIIHVYRLFFFGIYFY